MSRRLRNRAANPAGSGSPTIEQAWRGAPGLFLSPHLKVVGDRKKTATSLPFHHRQRHADHEVVAGRVVVPRPPAVVLLVRADAVEEIAILGGSVDECLAGEY